MWATLLDEGVYLCSQATMYRLPRERGQAGAAAAFERRAADCAKRITAGRWVFAVPQVWVINESDIEVRTVSHHALRPGEQEAITWMAYDEADGVDYGRVPYTRRPNGDPVFGEPEC